MLDARYTVSALDGYRAPLTCNFKRGLRPEYSRQRAGSGADRRSFKLEIEVASGGMGDVHLAEPLALGLASIRSRVTPEHPNALGQLTQMRQGSLRARLCCVRQEVQIERVLPRAPFDGARFDLGQIDVAQRE